MRLISIHSTKAAENILNKGGGWIDSTLGEFYHELQAGYDALFSHFGCWPLWAVSERSVHLRASPIHDHFSMERPDRDAEILIDVQPENVFGIGCTWSIFNHEQDISDLLVSYQDEGFEHCEQYIVLNLKPSEIVDISFN